MQSATPLDNCKAESPKEVPKSQSPPEDKFDYMFKIIIVGDMNVGKSSILQRYFDNNYVTVHQPTIGVDFRLRNITVDGKIVKLQAWDTAGQERFRSIAVNYYRGAHGIILVFDVTNPATFAKLPNWLDEIDRYADKGAVKLLVGNKCDAVGARKVTTQQAQKFAEEHGLNLLEASAMNSENIEKTFVSLTKDIKDFKEKRSKRASGYEPQPGFKPGTTPQLKNAEGCCT